MSTIKKTKDDYQYYQLITSEGLQDIEQPEPKQKSVFINPSSKNDRMKRYSYIGPVMLWDKCVIEDFRVQTRAVSEAKAKMNIIYQAKKKLDLSPGAGGVKLVNDIHLER